MFCCRYTPAEQCNFPRMSPFCQQLSTTIFSLAKSLSCMRLWISMKNLDRPFIPCPTCKTFGEIRMTDRLWKVLQKLQQLGPSTPPALHAQLRTKIVVGAINNSLEELHRLGFVDRNKSGRAWIYQVKSDQYPNKVFG